MIINKEMRYNSIESFLFIVLYTLWTCLSSHCEVQDRHKSVTISLWSNWDETPLLLETSEFLAEENEEFMWKFIDDIREHISDDGIKDMVPRDQYDVIVELSHSILSSHTKLSMLKFSLSLRTYSPTVAMFNQMANDVLKHETGRLGNCKAFVEMSSAQASGETRYACHGDAVQSALESLDMSGHVIHPYTYKIDHIYPSVHNHKDLPIAVLYGEIGTKSFYTLHDMLRKLSNDGKIKYVVRHYVANSHKRKVSLSGYGVELAIKSTEYKAQDDARVKGEETPETIALRNQTEYNKPDEIEGFIFSTLKESHPQKSDKIDEFQNHLLQSGKEIADLKVWELQELSLQAAKKILTSAKSDALRVMRQISQNFPTEARSLCKISVDSDLRREIDRNQQIFMQTLNLGTTDTALFINGLYFDAETVDIFTLLNTIKHEIKLVEGLHKIVGDNAERLKKLIRLDVNSDKQEYQIDIRDGAVLYVNDIEGDSLYKNWPSSLSDMLRAVYPGMLRNVRRNVFHLVLIIDPSKKESHDLIKLAESFYIHKAPVRVGFIFAVNPNKSIDGFADAGVACLEAFNFIGLDKTSYDGLSFITDVIAKVNTDKEKSRDLTSDDVINQFKKIYKNEDLDLIFGGDSDYDTGRKLAWEYIQKTGIGNPIKALLNGVILKESHLNAELFEEVVLTEIMKQTNVIQKAIYNGELNDADDILDWVMSQKSVMPRLNKLILTHDDTSKYLNLIGRDDDSHETIDMSTDFNTLKLNDLHYITDKQMNYITSDDGKCKAVTVLIAVNCQTKSGRSILLSALSYVRSNSIHMRIGVIYNGFGSVAHVIESAIKSIASNHLLQFLTKFLNNINQIDGEFDAKSVALQLIQQNYVEKFTQTFNDLTEKSRIFSLHSTFCTKALSIGNDDAVTILNGRIINVPSDNPFIEDDFSLMEKYSMANFAGKILAELSDDSENPKKCSDLVMKISSILLAFPQSKARHEIKYSSDEFSSLTIQPNNPNEPALDITVITEPLTRGAQKISSILLTLQKVFNCGIKIFFNCVDKHSEMPLKNFFRFVIEPEPNFGNGGPTDFPISRAHFTSLPTSPLLTLGMATPENWLVESVRSVYDLDNIHLDKVEDSGISADFELEHLLLEGHCFELSSGNPPRGLQFTLGTNTTPVMVDTIVMANLGYFQLKANPGNWILRLRQGRSNDIYNIVSHEGTDSSSDSSDVTALVSNFRSHVMKIRVNKKPGKQYEELLYDADDDEDDDSNSIWNSFGWKSSEKEKKSESIIPENASDSDRINIFSLASGHLYERLLRIMMLSVVKNTKTPVKFWFLKNYLSPNFKEILPFYAKKYNFEYELVQYKWPRWLHQQTEKQRIIWGYKILFLDVLFPLDVKKIIFVDADQVVRADLKELRDLDLEGAPYGYTPFCDSRKEMDGYRFWKSGYWSVHLHGRKYHISALYVVDLQKFRRIAAGDRLRGQYQGLSQDPNSLSNLDQDLPNNMIHQVSIKSLPNEWLWCETWCDDASKKNAKTIDLCNNPKTKEPKLTAARRIIKEWESYDNEIKLVLNEYETEKKSKANDKVKSDAEHRSSHTEL